MLRARLLLPAALLVFAAAPLLALALDAGYLIDVLSKIAIFALAASALNLVLGFGRMVSFGHAAYLGIGAYVTGILSLHSFEGTGLPAGNQALLAWPAAMLAAGIAALLIGAICLRARGAYFIMITLAFAQMFYFFFVSLERYGGDDGLSLWWGRNVLGMIELEGRLVFFYVCFTILGLWLLFQQRLVASPFGRVIRATRQNEERLAALGIPPYPYKLAAFALSGAVAGLAGALLANLNGFVSPGLMHWSRSGELMVMVVLGGLGTLLGPLLGTAAFVLLEEVLVSRTEHWQLLLGIVLLVVVLASRRGLVSLLAKPGDG